MADQQIHDRIRDLVAEEHELRSSGHGHGSDEHRRLEEVEVQLDQCWDLLRQRGALRNAGKDPSEAHLRPAAEVESYLQ